MDSCVWISSISDVRFEIYRPAIETWGLLPGKKILFLDGKQQTLNNIEVIDFWSKVDDRFQWPKEPRPTKAHRFWFKAYSLYYSLTNFKDDYVIWIDADVYANHTFDKELLDIKDHLFSTMWFKSNIKEKPEYVAETGLQIFNMKHVDIKKYAEEYISYWETLKLYDLYRGYDGYVTGDLIPKYDFVNLVDKDHSSRFPGQNTFEFTRFSKFLTHYLGIENKDKLKNKIID